MNSKDGFRLPGFCSAWVKKKEKREKSIDGLEQTSPDFSELREALMGKKNGAGKNLEQSYSFCTNPSSRDRE